jgi:hypothetical protein
MARFTFTIRAGNYGVVRMAAVHAPAGGISIGGKQFKGGEFIPGEVVERATAEEKAAIAGKSKDGTEAPKNEKRSKQTETPEFKKWFKQSKVVDEKGKPRVIFHGTRGFEGSEFKGVGKSAHSTVLGKSTFFFTESTDAADAFASEGEGAAVIPVYASIQRPFVIDAKGGTWIDSIAQVVSNKEKINTQHDGILIKNSLDSPFGESKVSNVWVAFDPRQLKSASGNKGTFDPSNPDIRMSSTRR